MMMMKIMMMMMMISGMVRAWLLMLLPEFASYFRCFSFHRFAQKCLVARGEEASRTQIFLIERNLLRIPILSDSFIDNDGENFEMKDSNLRFICNCNHEAHSVF